MASTFGSKKSNKRRMGSSGSCCFQLFFHAAVGTKDGGCAAAEGGAAELPDELADGVDAPAVGMAAAAAVAAPVVAACVGGGLSRSASSMVDVTTDGTLALLFRSRLGIGPALPALIRLCCSSTVGAGGADPGPSGGSRRASSRNTFARRMIEYTRFEWPWY